MIEVEYLLFLSDKKIIPSFSSQQTKKTRQILSTFSEADATEIKKIEQKIKHDVKAVEYFLRQKFSAQKIPNGEYIHIALTSEDTNSLAYSLLLKEAKQKNLIPELRKILQKLVDLSTQYHNTPMLSRTHGQPAVPTTVGKEIITFGYRIFQELQVLESQHIEAKLNGAVGNFNAHIVAFQKVNWPKLSKEFIKDFGLQPNLFTTQILPAETYAQLFSSLLRINSILLDLNQDLWRYISDGYFIQKLEKGQVGSSTMPHKVNPIEFENSEGNLGLANSLLQFFIQKLPISRLQRDLSDSTVKRSIGSAFGYMQLAYQSLQQGLDKVSVNQKKLTEDLNQHWEVVTEGLQVILRTEGEPAAYEKLRDFSQGKQINQENIHQFIEQLQLKKSTKKRLSQLTPFTYIGLSSKLTSQAVRIITNYLQGKT